MSNIKLIRSAAMLLVIAALAALTSAGVGIALAQGGQHAKHSRSYHAAKASAGALSRPAAKVASTGCPNWVPTNGSAPPIPPPGTPPKGTMSPANGSAPPTPPSGVPASSCGG